MSRRTRHTPQGVRPSSSKSLLGVLGWTVRGTQEGCPQSTTEGRRLLVACLVGDGGDVEPRPRPLVGPAPRQELLS